MAVGVVTGKGISCCAKKIPVILFIFLNVLLISSCEKVVETGEFNNLKIGSSKKQVIDALVKDKNIDSVQPALEEEISIDKSNLSKFSELEKSVGIVLRGPKFNAEILFVNNKVGSVKLAPVNKEESYGIVTGQIKSETLKIIKEIIRTKEKFYAFNVIPDSRWVILNQSLSDDNVSYLSRYDVWAYHENNTRSRTLLVFSDNKLSKVRYSWSPVELP